MEGTTIRLLSFTLALCVCGHTGSGKKSLSSTFVKPLQQRNESSEPSYQLEQSSYRSGLLTLLSGQKPLQSHYDSMFPPQPEESFYWPRGLQPVQAISPPMNQPRGLQPKESFYWPRGQQPVQANSPPVNQPRGLQTEESFYWPRGLQPKESFYWPRGQQPVQSISPPVNQPRGLQPEESFYWPRGQQPVQAISPPVNQPRGLQPEESFYWPRGLQQKPHTTL